MQPGCERRERHDADFNSRWPLYSDTIILSLMGRGSNIIRETGRGDEPPAQRAGAGPVASPAATCRPASRAELSAALSLVLGAAGEPAADVHVTDFLHFARNRGIRTADA